MLNKITGWESRTVPPLYVLMLPFFGESQSLGKPGKAKGSAEKQSSARHESEDLRIGVLPSARDYADVLCRRKTAAASL